MVKGISSKIPSYRTSVASDANTNEKKTILEFLLKRKDNDSTKRSMNGVKFVPDNESKINLGSNAKIAAPIRE